MSALETSFRLRIAPQWEFILPLIQARVTQLQLKWPTGLKAARLPRVYALTLQGKQTAQGTAGPVQTLLWEPPRERPIEPPFPSFSAIRQSFGLACKKALADANPGRELPVDALCLCLDAQGLLLPTGGADMPEQRVASIPLEAVVQTFFGVAAESIALERAGADFIVDKFVTPPQLDGLRVSRWRGDASHRLANQSVQMEIWMGE